jgi:hypothetical protein
MVCTKEESRRKAKSAEESALYYEFGSWLRTRHADLEPYRKEKVAGVVRGVITKLPFSLLYKVEG